MLGVDIEEPSIGATFENAARNGVELDARLVRGDEILPPADSAVANISVDAVRALPARVDAGMLVTSGYFLSERLELDGYTHVTRRTYDGWAADLHRRT